MSTRHEIYSLEGMAASYRETCESIAESNRAIRKYDAGAHQLAVSGASVSVIGWASGTTGDQRAIVTRSISARTHAVFAERAEDGNHVEDADEEQPAEPKRAKPEKAKVAKAPAKAAAKASAKSTNPAPRGKLYTVRGESMKTAEWAARLGCSPQKLYEAKYQSGGTMESVIDGMLGVSSVAKVDARKRAKPSKSAKTKTTRKPAPKPPAPPKGEIELLNEAIAEFGSFGELIVAAYKWRAVREITAQ